VEKMLKSSGRRVDLSTPFVDAMMPDGSRLHVVIPDITRRFWSVNIRKFVVRASHLDDLVALGSITPAAARFLDAAVRSGLNVLVSGGTQAGKTTLLNCLAAAVPPQERVVTAEEVFELKIPLPDVVSLQCRQPSLEGTGEIKLRRLVKEALRMRRSRIIVGEVRQKEGSRLRIAIAQRAASAGSGSPGLTVRGREVYPLCASILLQSILTAMFGCPRRKSRVFPGRHTDGGTACGIRMSLGGRRI
jgi:pilus assembly protein CpaF